MAKDEAFEVYKRYFTQLMILEVLSVNPPMDNQDMNREVIKYAKRDQKVLWKLTLSQAVKEAGHLAAIELIEISDDDKITITDKGCDALRSGIFQGLSNGACFNYKTLEWAKIAAIAACIAAIASLLGIIFQLL